MPKLAVMGCDHSCATTASTFVLAMWEIAKLCPGYLIIGYGHESQQLWEAEVAVAWAAKKALSQSANRRCEGVSR